MEKVINISSLKRKDIENLEVGKTVKIENNGKIINDT